MKIAIVGTGISSLTAAHHLHKHADLTLFEANDYIGGHTHTHEVSVGGNQHTVDTGFIVYNEKNYPHFTKMLNELGVATQPSEMSFSVVCERTDLEYRGADRFFVQKRNLLRPHFYKMIFEMLRFHKESKIFLMAENNEMSLKDYLIEHRYSNMFIDKFLIPMGAAIWSSNLEQAEQIPARFFIQFFQNHGFLDRKRPQWRVITGGSREYIRKLIPPFENQILLNTPVQSICRTKRGVLIKHAAGEEGFDRVVIGAHSNQALRLLADATDPEKDILGAIPYQKNRAVLHTDTAILPKRKNAWASWNYRIKKNNSENVTASYDMNILQNLKAEETFIVSLNQSGLLDETKIIKEMNYEHPLFTKDAVKAQKRVSEISGLNSTHYCGAYWGFGFHEDGVESGLRVAGEVI